MPRAVPTYRPPLAGKINQARIAAYERSPQRMADKAFYCSKRWLKWRAWFLATYPLCADCAERGKATAATEVHHVVKRKADPDRAFDETNCKGLCASCHAVRTNRGE